MKKYLISVLIILVSTVTYSAYAEMRELGLSAHLMPKRVADLDKTGDVKWGYIVTQPNDLRPPLERPIFKKPEELVDYFSKQSFEIQRNGLWIVTTHPDAYSDYEKESVERLKKLCNEKKIILFFCRGSKLPNGWVKGDLFSLESDK